jgi:acyl carrier protein
MGRPLNAAATETMKGKTMNQTQAFEKVMSVISPYAKNANALAAAKAETRLLEDLGVNSARLVDIVLAFEDEFAIAIDDEAADRIRTVGDAVNMVIAKSTH